MDPITTSYSGQISKLVTIRMSKTIEAKRHPYLYFCCPQLQDTRHTVAKLIVLSTVPDVASNVYPILTYTP